MIQHRVYQCPKCFNTLLVSNKMLHDLRCTEENPATYENILFRQSQVETNDSSYNNNYPSSSSRFSSRMSIKNDDGTMIDIVKEKTMKGKEEFVEIKYDPQGNIIGRKKAGAVDLVPSQNNFHDFSEYGEYDENFDTNYDNNNSTYYEVNRDVTRPSIIYETAEAPQEIVYTAPAKYDPHVTINKPIEETIINSHEGMDDGIIDNIIRNTMGFSNSNSNNQNDFKFDNFGGVDYSQSSQRNTNYSQSYNFGNYNNQSNMGNSRINTNPFQNNAMNSNNNSGNLFGQTDDFGKFDYSSYDFHY